MITGKSHLVPRLGARGKRIASTRAQGCKEQEQEQGQGAHGRERGFAAHGLSISTPDLSI